MLNYVRLKQEVPAPSRHGRFTRRPLFSTFSVRLYVYLFYTFNSDVANEPSSILPCAVVISLCSPDLLRGFCLLRSKSRNQPIRKH